MTEQKRKRDEIEIPAPLIRYAMRSWGSAKPEPFIKPGMKPGSTNAYKGGFNILLMAITVAVLATCGAIGYALLLLSNVTIGA